MLTLFDKHISVRVIPGGADKAFKDPTKPTVAEVNAGTEASKFMAMANFALGAVASESGGDPAVNGDPNAYFGTSNYEGTLTPFRYLDNDGKPIVSEDVLWPLINTKGTQVTIVYREGPGWDAAGVEGQEVSIFEATTDNPQTGDRTGYIKRTVPLAISRAWLDKKIVGIGG